MDNVQINTQPTIECKKITKSFGSWGEDVHVLRSIDLSARANEMIMLMGPSGSGKTTLLSIIGGILHQDSGECLILGKSINDLKEAEKTKFRGKNVGFLFQYFNLVPTLTAIENTAIPLILNGHPRHEAFEKSAALLLKLGLDKQRNYSPKELSGGEQQRIAIARAFIHNPKIILCDEPTSFLDHERGHQIMQLLRDIQKENHCTLIVVTHDQRILEFADRILEIEDGAIIHKSSNPTPTKA
ncbi:MAG: ABC transporter ATP-binding protein [Candidatus Babeliales bacterium]|jgi:putative ABC transport system ATP-binding protein